MCLPNDCPALHRPRTRAVEAVQGKTAIDVACDNVALQRTIELNYHLTRGNDGEFRSPRLDPKLDRAGAIVPDYDAVDEMSRHAIHLTARRRAGAARAARSSTGAF
jgi:hypothetical protein